MLIDHFNPVLVNHGFSTPDCLHEWLELKMHVLRRQERVSARPFWKEMFTDYSDRRWFINVMHLARMQNRRWFINLRQVSEPSDAC